MAGWWRWPGSRRALGLEIGSSGVRLVELERSARGVVTLHGCAHVSLSHGVVVDGQVEHFDAVARAIAQACERLRLRTRQVVMALPAASVLQRTVRLERCEYERRAAGARLETWAASLAPFSVEDLALDFVVLGPAPDSPREVEVLIAAARLDRVQDRLALAEAAGLEPAVIETESHATQRACQAWQQRTRCEPESATIALVELDPQAARLKVIDASGMQFERETTWRERAGAVRLAQEVVRLLQQFHEACAGRRLAGLMVAGEAAAEDGLGDALARASGLGVRLVDPFAAMGLGPQVDRLELTGHPSAYLQACGLALRGIEP